MSKRSVAGMVVVILFLAALSQAVVAQQGPGGGPGPMMRGGTDKELTPEQFSETKARLLKLIDERRTRLDKEKACVEASTNGEELKKCRPERPGGMKGGGMQGDPARQRGPRQGGEQRQ